MERVNACEDSNKGFQSVEQIGTFYSNNYDSLDSASYQHLGLKRSQSVLLAAVMILLTREPYLVT